MWADGEKIKPFLYNKYIFGCIHEVTSCITKTSLAHIGLCARRSRRSPQKITTSPTDYHFC